ncbi:hypothetical protein K7X08_016016 [Anisodus acutangulus]|uniref:Uncharacterized protein n=1 Tax=Anisodus acutangulus TaxID=402998 RepID=A0A9Q1LCJ7_9SOLA|nr:hypothetical protein K7X08_016016 [Anisodus acutangulus]
MPKAVKSGDESSVNANEDASISQQQQKQQNKFKALTKVDEQDKLVEKQNDGITKDAGDSKREEVPDVQSSSDEKMMEESNTIIARGNNNEISGNKEIVTNQVEERDIIQVSNELSGDQVQHISELSKNFEDSTKTWVENSSNPSDSSCL